MMRFSINTETRNSASRPHGPRNSAWWQIGLEWQSNADQSATVIDHQIGFDRRVNE